MYYVGWMLNTSLLSGMSTHENEEKQGKNTALRDNQHAGNDLE
jgi:hypothetical protein